MAQSALIPTAEIHQLSTKPMRDAVDPTVLIAESNHRIANNLSAVIGLVRMQAAAVGDRKSMTGSEVRVLLEEIAGRIDAIGALHKKLAQHPLQPAVDVADYLRGICASLVSPLSCRQRFELTQNFEPDCLVSRDQIVSLALIVNELVTNATKYAHPTGVPGKIVVSCRHHAAGGLMVEVTDDGIGLPENFNPKVDGDVGLRVVRLLAAQTDAELAFESSSLGLTVRLIMPMLEN